MSELGYQSVFENYRGKIHDIDSQRFIDSEELKKCKNAVIGFLKAQGVRPLERVAVVLHSSVAMIINFFALMEIGAVPILLSKLSTWPELKNFDERYGIHWLISDSPLGEVGPPVFSTHTPVRFEVLDYCFSIRLINKSAEIFSNLQGAILLPTSGSTGEVKLCIRPESNCLAEPLNHIESSAMSEGGRLFCPLPLTHAYGFGTALLLSLILSMDLILLNELNPRKIIQVFHEYKISIFTGVPSIYDLLGKMKISQEINLPPVLLSAGAPLERSTAVHFFNRFQSYIRPSYGSTETGEICCEQENVISDTGSVGKPLKRTRVKIEKNQDGFEEVIVSNPSIMLGYLGANGAIDRSQLDFENWFPTGDMGAFDSSGRLVLTGRLKNIINIFGVKVNPIEVERVIRSIEGVHDAHVYPGRHRSGSDLVYAIVQCNNDVNESVIIKTCKDQLTPQKVPSKVFIVDKLPRNQSGKIIAGQLPVS